MIATASEILEMKKTQLYINGEWVDGEEGTTFGVINPATEETIVEVSYGTAGDARRALEAAQAALADWRGMTVYERALRLKKIADAIRENIDYLAVALTMEQGKPLVESRAEMLGSAGTFEWFAEEAKRAYGRTIPASFSHKRLFTVRHPVGVCASVSPWNFPILLQARKIAPAMAVGCTTVSRPSSQTPLSLIRLFELIEDVADLPKGVVNLVMGPPAEIMEEFMSNRICRKISFTGSTEVGKDLLKRSSEQVKRLSLELGGHAPVLVFPDVDIEAAAKVSVLGKFRNNGQVCICPTRFYAEKSIEQDFLDACVEETKKVKLGNGLEEEVDVGPMFEARALDKTDDLIKDALSKGANCILGGSRSERFDKGYFFEPTVLTGMQDDMKIMTDEPFAPVMPILSFNEIDEAIAKANNTDFGLAAYVLTNDLTAAMKCADGLEFGTIGINDTVPATPQGPFGGLKESGVGRENGIEGLDAYLETKFVSMALRES
ncbi:MAG: Glutarate-semialdehyde dehydrogenase DavD [Candidatus Moanabacter tarae]|uniref:Glutarate-semialdehyde dehydrogenase DavD n=1 Tax=Candidatus Moanibacter tarae TaxID=2200854 RepID=A0A2Z4ANK4_9BACT|nr:MAG: Glutarate-semialdehyde dehydrogenase DavD [Candidatus Moanabacter tarae]|tara:strand:+ start:22064 stop:23539 length:1476 start_codon:yes stop_codon:yes gene_type:complete